MALFSKKKEAEPDNAELLATLANIKKETEAAEKAHQKLGESIDELKDKLSEESLGIHNEYLILKKNLESMKRRLNLVVYELKRQAAMLNYVIRTEELDILKKRIELWNPEQMVTKKEFEKMLEEAKNSESS